MVVNFVKHGSYYCEDTDLALRIWKAGYRFVCDPDVIVHHYEYGSYSKGRPPSASAALILSNRQILRRKHAGILKQQPAPGSLSALFAGDHRYRQGNVILLIEDCSRKNTLIPAMYVQ